MAAKQRANAHAVPRMSAKVAAGRPPSPDYSRRVVLRARARGLSEGDEKRGEFERDGG